MLNKIVYMSLTCGSQASAGEYLNSYLFMAGGIILMIAGAGWGIKIFRQGSEKRDSELDRDVYEQIHSTIQSARSPRGLRAMSQMPPPRILKPDTDATQLLDNDQTVLMNQGEVETSLLAGKGIQKARSSSADETVYMGRE